MQVRQLWSCLPEGRDHWWWVGVHVWPRNQGSVTAGEGSSPLRPKKGMQVTDKVKVMLNAFVSLYYHVLMHHQYARVSNYKQTSLIKRFVVIFMVQSDARGKKCWNEQQCTGRFFTFAQGILAQACNCLASSDSLLPKYGSSWLKMVGSYSEFQEDSLLMPRRTG